MSNTPGQSPITPSSTGTKEKSKAGLFGRKGKNNTSAERGPKAWVAGHPQRQPYDADGLMIGRPMQELWEHSEGNCFVYLHPQASGNGASFKVDSAVFASSPVLTRLAFGDLHSRPVRKQPSERSFKPLDVQIPSLSLNDPSTSPFTPQQKARTMDSTSSLSSHDSRRILSDSSDAPFEAHLFLPIKLTAASEPPNPNRTPPRRSKDGNDPTQDDLQTLIDVRNFFAFLCGQSLVATEKKHSFFHIFMTIAGILKTYEFSNLDGSTYGEVASGSFDNYVEELGLADVRSSREKTIEGILLGERMKSVFLYNEAFTHGAGKYEDLANLKSPKFSLLSSVTGNRLIRAAMDLDKRTASIRLILNDFDFPALFTGIMASKTSEERKEGVRFEAWKDAFLGFRKNYISICKRRYGNWPPQAKSKKNELETSGLNRLVLRDVYHDMSALYDTLVDRYNLTSRTVDGINHAGPREQPTTRALRALLSEYDRSSPPVKPPVPFDLPRMPSLQSIRPDFGTDKRKDLKASQKKLKDEEVVQILRNARNSDVRSVPFLDSFREMELRAGHGCTVAELVDLRVGQWIFMYVVLQALPMLACDAPSLKWTKGVEYFLCEPPRSGVPWATTNATNGNAASTGGSRTWFSVGESGGVVSLPSDVVEHGVEGIYRRSHCWVMAEKWTREDPVLNEALHIQEANNAQSDRLTRPFSPGPAPSASSAALLPPNANDTNNSRPSSRASKRISSFGIGLEALPLPAGVTPDASASGYQSGGSRPTTPQPYQQRQPSGQVQGGHSRIVSGQQGQQVPQHVVDSSKTFDAILAGVPAGKKGKK